MSNFIKSISEDVVFFSYRDLKLLPSAKSLYVWDLDKTYLDTRFENIRSLLKTAFENSKDKANVPGTKTLLQSLDTKDDDSTAIFFITASPPQMEEKIFRKLRLDGIRPWGIFFKNNLKNIFPPSRWRRLTQHVGYKLQALLHLHLLGDSKILSQFLWGDDSEMDAVIYSLYSDICSHRLKGEMLEAVLKHFHISAQCKAIMDLQEKIIAADPVKRIYINLEEGTDVEYYQKFGSRVLPTYTSFQSAIDCFKKDKITLRDLVKVGQDLRDNYLFSKEAAEKSLLDLATRQVLDQNTYKAVVPSFKKAELISELFEIEYSADPVFVEENQREEDKEVFEIDYFNDYR
ncbi:MAG: hypothetical protein HAW63_04060 [Bdellovibrionaceae bacterium]|nr:hypothetical protein [Pseudobdellovibrionaceae bacterium]